MSFRLNKGVAMTSILLVSTLLYSRSFTNFFFGDDFYHFWILRTQNVIEGFNLFARPVTSYFGYRPIPNQIYWRLGEIFFGLQPLGYHIINHAFFLLSGILTYVLTKMLSKSTRAGLIAMFIYALNSTHFYRLFFLSNIEETMLAVFVLLTIIFYIRNSFLSAVFFILSLMCKETAIVTPIILLAYDLLIRKKLTRKIIVFVMIGAGYLLSHKFLYGFLSGGDYTMTFNPLKIINNYLWYFLWTVGFPESFVNTRLGPALFTSYGQGGALIAALVLSFMVVLLIPLWNWFKNRSGWRIVLFGLSLFLIFIGPVSLFPFHKFPYSLSVPLIGFSLAISMATFSLKTKALIPLGLLYLFISLLTTDYNLNNHWSVKRADMAALVLKTFPTDISFIRSKSNIYFSDPVSKKGQKPNDHYASKELYYALSGPNALRIYYNDQSLPIYFEGFDLRKNLRIDSLIINSRDFL